MRVVNKVHCSSASSSKHQFFLCVFLTRSIVSSASFRELLGSPDPASYIAVDTCTQCVHIFICVGTMAAPFHDQTTLFCNQTLSSLLSFHVYRASERNVILAMKSGDNSEFSYGNLMVHSLRSKYTRYPSCMIFEKQSFALMLSSIFHSLLGSRCDPNDGCQRD